MEKIKIKEIDEDFIKNFSELRKEPEWLLKLRLRAFKEWKEKEFPKWLKIDNEWLLNMEIDFDEVSGEIVNNMCANCSGCSLGLQNPFSMGYGFIVNNKTYIAAIKPEYAEKGVVSISMDDAVKKYENVVKKYFGRIVPYNLHKYSLIHYALWSGGHFIYVPKNVKLELPFEQYLSFSGENLIQFEHTMLIVDDNAQLKFTESCTPASETNSWHNGAVEAYVGRNSILKFSTIQNWNNTMAVLSTKRAIVKENGSVYWVEASLGGKYSIVYPSAILSKNGKAEIISSTMAKENSYKDAGAKVYVNGENAKVIIRSRSVAYDGEANFRAYIHLNKNAENSVILSSCDSYLMEDNSKSLNLPIIRKECKNAEIMHEANVGKINEEILHFIRTRGFEKEEAEKLAIIGYLSSILEELPDYHRQIVEELIASKLEGGVG